MANNNLKQEDAALEKIDSILFGLLQKYNLEETDEQTLEKFEKGEDLNDDIILDIALRVITKKISKNNFVSSLEAQLKISKETAEKLAEDIEEKILPLVKETSLEKKLIEKEEPITAMPTKPPIGLEKIVTVEEKIKPVLKSVPFERSAAVEKTKRKETLDKKQREPRKNDIYREPIE